MLEIAREFLDDRTAYVSICEWNRTSTCGAPAWLRSG